MKSNLEEALYILENAKNKTPEMELAESVLRWHLGVGVDDLSKIMIKMVKEYPLLISNSRKREITELKTALTAVLLGKGFKVTNVATAMLTDHSMTIHRRKMHADLVFVNDPRYMKVYEQVKQVANL